MQTRDTSQFCAKIVNPPVGVGLKLLAPLLLALLLGGCATPGEKNSTGVADPNVGIIKPSFSRVSFYNWTSYSLKSVDGVRTPMGLFSDPSSYTVPPGKLNLVVHASYNRGGSASQAEIPLQAEIKPGKTYEITGSVTGQSVEAWLVDAATQEKVSDSFSSSATRMPQAPTLIRFSLPK